MPTVADITGFLERLAPAALAEEWDNVGLLIGDAARDVANVMTCLTLSPDVAAEAIRWQAQLVVTHHPLLFRPVQRLTAETPEGRMLLELIEAGVAVYSPHTAYDSAAEGINQQWAESFRLQNVEALQPWTEASRTTSPDSEPSSPGAGRCGDLPGTVVLREFVEEVKQALRIESLRYAGHPELVLERIGIACGSAAGFLPDARARGCQALITGEAKFHHCLEARSSGMGLVLIGHYASERPAMERMADILQREFPGLTVWASDDERDPVQWA